MHFLYYSSLFRLRQWDFKNQPQFNITNIFLKNMDAFPALFFAASAAVFLPPRIGEKRHGYGTRKGLKRNKKPQGFLLERKARFFAASPQKMRPKQEKNITGKRGKSP
jgi:hypothetical protein